MSGTCQKCPDILSYLQQIIDEHNLPGDFIITGSQNYLLMERVTQSLAGRIGIHYLLPFSSKGKDMLHFDRHLKSIFSPLCGPKSLGIQAAFRATIILSMSTIFMPPSS